MNLFKVIVIVSLVLFISVYIYNSEHDFDIDSCFVDTNTVLGPINSIGSSNIIVAHGGGLNKCGCHFNRKTGECHCHRNKGCGCECQPSSCK